MKLLNFVIGFVSLFLRAYIMTNLWSWYISPFTDFKLSLIHAVGLIYFWALINLPSITDITLVKDMEEEERVGINLGYIFISLIFWLVAWIFHFFM